MGKRGPVPQRRKKISCHLGIRATKLFEEKLPKLPHDKRNRPLIGEYLSGLIERDLSKPQPKTKPGLAQRWLEEDEKKERKARRKALERGELHDEDDDESFY